MVREVSDHNATQEEMDNNQYLKNGILRYQRVFGYTFVSTGGKQTTEVCKKYFRHAVPTTIQNIYIITLIFILLFYVK